MAPWWDRLNVVAASRRVGEKWLTIVGMLLRVSWRRTRLSWDCLVLVATVLSLRVLAFNAMVTARLVHHNFAVCGIHWLSLLLTIVLEVRLDIERHRSSDWVVSREVFGLLGAPSAHMLAVGVLFLRPTTVRDQSCLNCGHVVAPYFV